MTRDPQYMAMTPDELKDRRVKLGLTQSQLGLLLMVPTNTIARWERGELTIQHPEILRLALAHLRCMSRGGNPY